MKAFIKKNIVNFICAGLILTVCLWNLRDYDYIRSVDEFGYFGVAASFAGWDWSDMLATSDYYSFGYSFLLVPFMLLARLGIPMALIYKAVILLNGCFLVGVFALVMHVQREIFPDFPDQLQSAAALMMALYIANAVQSNTAGVEMCLRFLFWAILSTLISFVKKPGIGNSTLLIGLSIYIFTVHMRAIGVSIAVAGVLVLYVISHVKAINKKLLIYMVGLTVAGMLAFVGVKSYVADEIYVNHYSEEKGHLEENEINDNINNLDRNLKKVKNLMTTEGLQDLGMSICGKLYYAFSATFLLVEIGIAFAIGTCINLSKRIAKWNSFQWYALLAFLAFMGEIMVSSIYKIMPFYRGGQLHLYPLETIVFGRYADFAVGGLMLLGIYGLYYVEQYVRQIAFSVVCFLGLAWVVQYQFDMMTVNLANDKIANFRINQTPWFAVLSNGNINYFAYYAAAVSIAFFTVMVFAGGCKKRKKEMLTMVMLGVCFMWGAMSVHYSKEYNDSKGHRVYQIGTVVDIISATDENTQIYYIGSDYRDGGSDVEILQWRLGKRTIHVRTLADLDNDEVSSAILLCHSNNQEIMEALMEEGNYIFDSTALQVYVSAVDETYEVMRQKAAEVE